MLTKDDLQNNLDRVHEWIRSADYKVSIFLAFQGLMTVLVITDLFERLSKSVLINVSLDSLLISIILITLSYSILKSFFALHPRLNLNTSRKSATYFHDISKRTLASFRRFIKKIDQEHYKQDLIEQIYYASKVAEYKYIHFREAMILFVVAFFFILLEYLLTLT